MAVRKLRLAKPVGDPAAEERMRRHKNFYEKRKNVYYKRHIHKSSLIFEKYTHNIK